MRISKFLLNVFCLSLVCAGVSAQESQEPRYFKTAGTEIKNPNELVTGYYIINAVGPNHGKKGLLCWNSSSSPSSFGIDTQKPYYSLTDQLLSTTEDVCKYIFYIEVNNTDFTIKSVQGDQYMSKSYTSAAEKLTYVQSTTSGNDVAKFTLEFEYDNVPNVNIPFIINRKKVEHFIVKLNNGTTSKGNPLFLHSKAVAPVLPLSFYKGYNTEGGTCSKLAFFKLSPVPVDVVNFTYEYIVNEEVVKTEKHKEEVGQPYPPIAKIHDFWKVTTNNIPGENVSAEDKDRTFQVKVEWDGPFNLTESEESLDNANWYHLNFTPSRKVITNMGERETIPVRTATSTPTVSSKELWAFVGNPFKGFKIYNAYKSNGVYGRLVTPTIDWTNNGRNANPYVSYEKLEVGTSDVWTISDPRSYDLTNFTVDDSFFIGYQFNENKVYNLNFNSDYLSFWTNGQGNRSAFTVNQNVTGSLDKQIVFKSGGDNYYYSTFYIDYPVQVKSDYIEVYTGTLDEVNGILQMTKSTDNIIPAHTGVILRMHKNDFDANANHSYALTNASPMLQQASLSGTIEEILLDNENRDKYLVFGMNKDKILGFYKPSSKITSIAPYKAFLNWSSEMSVRAFKLVFDETTSIDASTIFGDEENSLSPQAPIYDLSGRPVQHTTRGIYIQHGKKVFVK